MSSAKTVPHYSFSGSKGAYTVWQHTDGETQAVGTITPCVELDHVRYGVPRAHRWKVDARVRGVTVTATDKTLTRSLTTWCRTLRNRTREA